MIAVERLAAFSDGDRGGNPAGVVVGPALPDEATMRRIAAEVGYSETAFAAPQGDRWRVRYFSPEAEVPFCGHATIALGAALAMRHGDGVFGLVLDDVAIAVEGHAGGGTLSAALTSPPTRSAPAAPEQLAAALRLFALDVSALDARIPPALIHAGADHLLLALKNRATLAAMAYDFEQGRALMRREGWVTVILAYAESAQRFDTRNAFAYGGVYEDPATGASSAALAGYLRDLGWPHGGAIDLRQGDDMGIPSRIHARFDAQSGAQFGTSAGGPIRVSGTVRPITP
jgi:PhzF family phenazine biosynthesis protein